MARGRVYPSDLTDEQWLLVEPLLPAPRTSVRDGRRAKHPRRQFVDAILYVARTGCQWRCLPNDFPLWPTVYWYFTRWHDDGTVNRVHDALRVQVRQAEGRSPEPTAALIDSQSVRPVDSAPVSTSGFDAEKEAKGRKRFIVIDILGVLLAVPLVAAGVQDRDGGKRPLLWAHVDYPTVLKFRADQGFAGRLVQCAAGTLRREVDIVPKQPGQPATRPGPKTPTTSSLPRSHTRSLVRTRAHRPAAWASAKLTICSGRGRAHSEG